MISLILVVDLRVKSRKCSGDFGKHSNIWCNVSRKLRRQVAVALHAILSAKQTSQQVSDFRNRAVLEEHFLNSFLLLKLNKFPSV